MRVLLPPSETKRDGGDGGPVELASLTFPELTEARRELMAAVATLAVDEDAAMRALKLGPRQSAEVERNRRIHDAPSMPAIDRYTGVLFDALDAPTLSAEARSYAAESVMVHSALFGLVGALDPIPAYRLSHDSRLPGIRLRQFWRARLEAALAELPGVILDLRSEGYVGLGPPPAREDSVFIRVVSVGDDGRRRALNHFNKTAKGTFTRAVLESRPQVESVAELIEWARDAGFVLDARDGTGRAAAVRELELVA
jgi:cytoplasmic iron level regulating protein YaaA (DUF328/UPF0246 family)